VTKEVLFMSGNLLSPEVIQPQDARLSSRLKGSLRDFAPDLDAESRYPTGAWAINRELKVAEELRPLPYTVFITLCKLAGYKYFGREEKVSWAIPVTFKGVPFLLAHRKSGFKVSSAAPPGADDELAAEMLTRLGRAISIADRLMEPEVKARIRAGKVTVINRYNTLRHMYRFFRDKAAASFAAAPASSEEGGAALPSESRRRASREGFYYTVSMLDAYFSLLEHVLILLLPFAGFDPARDDLVGLIGAQWGDKFKRLFDVNADRTAKRHYDALKEVKERYRNTASHGMFEKGGASLYFHDAEVGSVPVRLSRHSDGLHFLFTPVDEVKFAEICALLDAAEAFLKDGPTRLGMKHVEEGLDSIFAVEWLNRYRAATASDEDFEQLLEYENYLVDQHANMDF
jgi:aryl carrier-like protein